MFVDLQHDSRHFYCVTSTQTSTTYHPESHPNPYVLEPNCPFSWQDVCPEAIEHHLNAADSHATCFISVFARFADALKLAYHLYTRGDEAITIIQLDAAALLPCPPIHAATGAAVPLWKGPAGDRDAWLSVADVVPLLVSTDPRRICLSEWLACGGISRSRFRAAWPVIGGKLFCAEGKGVDLVDLYAGVCGRAPDFFRRTAESKRVVFDWGVGAFVEKEGWMGKGERGGSVSGVVPAVGLRSFPWRWSGFEGYLRGTVVMD